ncbi:MAG: hypothetical protein AB7K09_17190 [Planctomycetota bacterium]
MTARKKTTRATKKTVAASEGGDGSNGATRKTAATKKSTKATSKPASKATARQPARATKKKVAPAAAPDALPVDAAPDATPDAPAPARGKKLAKKAAAASKPAKGAASGARHAAEASDAKGPAVDELMRRWKLVLSGPIRLCRSGDQSGDQSGIAIAAADVQLGSRHQPLQYPFADWLADNDSDAAVQKLHEEFELSSADAPWVRARLESDFNAPARFEEDREDAGTCVEANFVAVLDSGGSGELLSVAFRVTDHNAAAGLRFGDPVPDERIAEAVADAFWRRLVESGAPLKDFTDRAHLEAAGGQASFGVQNGQPFIDESAMLSDEMDLGEIVSRRLPPMKMAADGGDDDDDEDDDDDDDDDDSSTSTPASGAAVLDDDYRRDPDADEFGGPPVDDDEPEKDEDDEDEDEDDDEEEGGRRRDDDDDYMRMMMGDDDDW